MCVKVNGNFSYSIPFLLLAASSYLTATVNILCYLKILIFCENLGF